MPPLGRAACRTGSFDPAKRPDLPRPGPGRVMLASFTAYPAAVRGLAVSRSSLKRLLDRNIAARRYLREVNMTRFWRLAAITMVMGLAFECAPQAASAAASSSPSPALVAA